MGTASATPQRLYDYSAQTTHACGDLASYVRSTLACCLATYHAGAVSYGAGVNTSIGAELDHLLTRIWATDSHVRTVGRRFQQAGAQSNPIPPWLALPLQPYPTTRPVTTTDQQLDASDLAAGAALARLMPESQQFGGQVLTGYWKALADHLDDPLFCAGFYNALTREQLEALPWNDATSRALAQAFASGKLTRAAQVDIAYVIMDRLNNGELPTLAFRALAANPQGAAAFARYLMSDPEAMRLFLRAKGWSDWYPGFHPDHGQARFLQGLLPVLASATTVMSPGEVQALLGKVGGALPDLDVADARAISPQLRQFLSTAAARVLPLPVRVPGEPYQETLQKWAAQYGTTMQSLLTPYENWIGKIYTDHQQAMAAEHAFAENFVLGAIGAILTAPVGGEGAFVVLGANGLYGSAAGALQPWIDSNLHWDVGAGGPAADPKNYLHKSAIVAVITAAYLRGMVGRNGEPVTLDQLQHDPRYAPGLQKLLASVERGEHPGAGDTDWAYELHLKDGGNLGAVIDALRSHFQ